MSGYFIVGTDTGVGKTVVSALLLHHLQSMGANACYHKPVQTGFPSDHDQATVKALSGVKEEGAYLPGLLLPRPLSPHLSAHYAGTRIDLKMLIRAFEAGDRGQTWIIEGAGGLLVPLNERALMAHLVCALKRPAVVVARSTLGTINHTLLTLKVLRAFGISLAGVALVGPKNSDTAKTIAHFGQAPILFEMPFLTELTAQTLREFAEGSEALRKNIW